MGYWLLSALRRLWRLGVAKIRAMPYKEWAHLVRLELPESDMAQIVAALRAHEDLYQEAPELSWQISVLTEDNSRLKHENAFMLKLINEREN